MVNIITNSHINYIYLNKSWLVSDTLNNLVGNLEKGINDIVIELLYDCISPQEKNKFIKDFADKKNHSINRIQDLVDTLLINQLLTVVDNNRYDSMDDVSDYLHFRYSVNHADYSNKNVYDDDCDRMHNYLAIDDYPLMVKSKMNDSQIELFHPAWAKPVTRQSRLASLLFYTFGCLRDATFFHDFKVMLKCAPSKGARHPFDVYLIDDTGEYFSAGFYYYHPEHHKLYQQDFQNICTHGSFRLYIVMNFERYQWRYRHSWAYKDIFYDLGHIIEIMKNVANKFKIELKNMSYVDCFPNEKPLYEECFFSCEINMS